MKLSEYIDKFGDFEINEEKAKELIIERKERWKPEMEEGYWYIGADGYTHDATWAPFRLHQRRYDLGNCFKTKKEVEFALEQIKVTQELKDYADLHNECEIDWNIDWNNETQTKYYIIYKYYNNTLYIDHINSSVRYIGQIYFTSYEVARNAMLSVGEDRIKKYLFGVNE